MFEDRDIEVSHDVSSFVAELRRLADALENGDAYTISMDGEDVTIPQGAHFSVAHDREDGEVELEFQVTWTMDDDEDADADEETESA
jgi:amphi-Trp domain-containing protein